MELAIDLFLTDTESRAIVHSCGSEHGRELFHVFTVVIESVDFPVSPGDSCFNDCHRPTTTKRNHLSWNVFVDFPVSRTVRYIIDF